MLDLKIPTKTGEDYFDLADFQDDFNALNSDLDNKTIEIATINDDIIRVKNNLSQNVNEISNNTKKINQANSDISSIEREIENISTSLSSMNELLQQLSSSVNNNITILDGIIKPKTEIRAGLNGDFSVGANTWTILPFGRVANDTLSELNTSTGKVTVKEDGTYMISCHILVNSAVSGSSIQIGCMAGAENNLVGYRIGGAKFGTATSFIPVSGCITTQLKAGDIAYIQVFSTKDDKILGTTLGYTTLCVTRIK